MPQTPPDLSTPALARALRLTRAGLTAERIVRAFWPLWAILTGAAGALLLGLHEIAPLELVRGLMVVVPVAALVAAVFGLRRFRLPRAADVQARLDATLPGRPIAALTDTQAIGADDAASRSVWEAHRARMAARLQNARAPRPNLNLAARDPFGLRYVGLLVLSTGLLFGSVWRVDSLGDMAPGQAGALAMGPAWEAWIEPPRYTGQPSLYLGDIRGDRLEVPQGTRVLARLYGEVGQMSLTETVSGRIEDEGAPTDPVQDFEIDRDGEIAINGPGGRAWQIVISPDTAPAVTIDGPMSADAVGALSMPFSAQDDYGVEYGRAVMTLDLAAVDRRYGRTVAPEPREPLVIDLPLPISADRSDFSEMLTEDMSEHPWANLPVSVRLEVDDARGQTGVSEETAQLLPGRRFFVPLAKAIIEERQALLWSRENAAPVAQVLRAISNRPGDVFSTETDYLRLRHAVRQIEASLEVGPGMTETLRDEIAQALWDLALRIEEGDLANAMERLRRAQDQLAEAIRDGASDEEIERLMQELREALQDYMRQLAEQNQQQGGEQDQAQNQQSMEMSGDQLQQMLDKLQQLMEEGRMAEAAQMLEMLRQMMENMQVTQGGQGGQGSPGQQALQGLQETLRDQQDLSDESFDELQEQFNEGQQGQQGQSGEGQQGQGQPGQGQPGQGQGQQGQGQAGQGGSQGSDGLSLAERQQALRESLRQQQEGLPGNGAADDALDRAGRAMDDAEDALRNDDIAGALDSQSEAMDALRDGMQALSEEMAQQQQQGGEGQGGSAEGQAAEGPGRDPLGRLSGTDGNPQTQGGELPGQSPAGRARDLQDEIRRRSTEQARPEAERDYLNRLIDRF